MNGAIPLPLLSTLMARTGTAFVCQNRIVFCKKSNAKKVFREKNYIGQTVTCVKK